MTLEEFDNTEWGANMQGKHDGLIKDIVSVNFFEKLIGFDSGFEDDDISWARCENVEIIK